MSNFSLNSAGKSKRHRIYPRDCHVISDSGKTANVAKLNLIWSHNHLTKTIFNPKIKFFVDFIPKSLIIFQFWSQIDREKTKQHRFLQRGYLEA